jgi:hypothetical protein
MLRTTPKQQMLPGWKFQILMQKSELKLAQGQRKEMVLGLHFGLKMPTTSGSRMYGARDIRMEQRA